MEKKVFYLGVEGGGTNSAAILADENLQIIGEGKGKAINYEAWPEQIVKENVASLLAPFLKRIQAAQLFGVFGLAGVETPKDILFYKKLIRQVLPPDARFDVVNDAKIALEVRCKDSENKVLVISGTGSNVYGENGKDTARTVGWGFVLGDEGSAYDIGLRGLKSAMRSWDGRGKKTILENFIFEKTKTKAMDDFIPKIYHDLMERNQNMKSYIASFAPLVDRAVEQNDEVAMEIREIAAEELAHGVAVVAEKLNFKEKDFCLGTVGSVWDMAGLKEIFGQKVKEQCPNVGFSQDKTFPAWGGVLLAKELAN